MSESQQARVQAQFGPSAAAYVKSPGHAAGPDLDQLLAWGGKRGAARVLDVATGGGHTALAFSRFTPSVVAVDLTLPMLQAAREFVTAEGAAGVRFLCADAEALPLPARAVDAYTIAFGIRNVTRIERALAEARRVLRPGGRFLCLEFSHLQLAPLERLYEAYSFAVVPWLGEQVAGDRPAYQYLVESIRRFPDQATFAQLIERAGLGQVRWRNLSGGIAALHSAWRL